MLLELMQGTEAGGFIIIQDSTSYSGRHLLRSFINAALNRIEVVHILGFEVSEEELKDGLNGSYLQRLYFHNAYVDPLGWTENPPFTAHQFTTEEITNLFKQTLQPKPAILVIDSLSWILRHLSAPAICKTLQQLKKGGAVRTIIGLLHSDMHQRGMVGSVCHLATSVITVTPGVRGNEAVAKTTRRSKSGKIMQDEEIFSIKEDLAVTIQSRPNHPGTTQADPDEPEADPTANLTFNLRLSDTEREAKEKLALPFVFSKEKKSALLRPVPGSGRILYEPDANDDYDQEDPDDDLDV
ncbi:elongator complex protein 5 isoform 1-T2 [Polymixia lowei]